MLKVGFSQAAYDKFLHDINSATLKAQGGSYGGERNIDCTRE